MTILSDGFLLLSKNVSKKFSPDRNDRNEQAEAEVFSKILIGHIGIEDFRPLKAVGFKTDDGFGIECSFEFKAKDGDCGQEQVAIVIGNTMAGIEVFLSGVMDTVKQFVKEHNEELASIRVHSQPQGEA